MDRNQFAVIGHPISHTMSPFIHARLFALTGHKGFYGVRNIRPEVLEEKLPELRCLDGFNITIPHKQAIIPLLDSLDEKAAFFLSVNTVKNTNGRLTGYTTDGTGFTRALEAAGADFSGRTVILGAGGVARVMAFEAALRGSRVTVAAREHSLEEARRLSADIMEKVPGAQADFCKIDQIPGSIHLLVNATPLGMYPNTDSCPVSEKTVQNSDCVFDAVYNPNETVLLQLARKNGVRAVDGMSMLVWQAAAAHEIWYGAQFDREDMERLCADAVFEMKKTFGNLILCGFMGCGKTTVGTVLAQRTGRRFVDLDCFIEQQEGMTVSEIFAARGEAEFRQLEREAAAALCRKSNLIVAAGGGTLLNPETASLFRQNGIIVLLDADIKVIKERLQGDRTRPLLAKPNRNKVMEQLYAARIGVYRTAADFAVPADGDAKQVAEQILEELKKPPIV